MLEYPSKSKLSGHQPVTLADQWQFPGNRLALLPGISVITDQKLAWLVISFFFLYLFAGETASLWIYLMTAGVLATILLSIILPFFQLLDTQIALYLPSEGISGERIIAEIEVRHALCKGIFAQVFPLRWLRLKLNLGKHGRQRDKEFFEQILVEYVTRREVVNATSRPLSRGIYKFISLEAASCFPFAITWWLAKVPTTLLQKSLTTRAGTLAVYPRIIPMRGRFLQSFGAGAEATENLIASHKPTQQSCSVRGLREYRIGDSPRWVHWPSSARLDHLMVKEFDADSAPQYYVALDTHANWHSEDQFELAVCLANSIIHSHPKRKNFDLLVPPSENLRDIYGMPNSLARSREVLLRVQPEGDNNLLSASAIFQQENNPQTSEEQFHKRLVSVFRDTLQRHPDSIIFAILPGSGITTVNLHEINLSHHRLSNRYSRSQHHHALSTRQISANRGRAGLTTMRNQVIMQRTRSTIVARISHLEQISLL